VTKILLADDHPLVRQGLRRVLERERGFEIVAEVSDGAEAVEQVEAHDVDLAILDVAMERMTGLQAAEIIAKRHPRTRVLLLSMYDNDQYLFAAVRAGASGYILKSVADEEVVDACRAVLNGQGFLYPSTVGARTRELLERGGTESALTPREEEILKLVAEGHSSQTIAGMLFISVKTVERHRANIGDKLGIRDRVGLTRYAIRHGLAEP
jgi:DNA-binding NarL/FixJ family response regulator